MNENILHDPERRRRQLECPVLITDRLVLRSPHQEDMDAIADLANNRRVSVMLAKMPYPFTRAHAASFIKRVDGDEMGYCAYVITLADSGAFIGTCCLEAGDSAESAEIIYWVGEPFWGKGYATEAVNALVDAVFRATDIDRLTVDCPSKNVGARRVLQKCGFRYLGSGEKTMQVAGIYSVQHYALDRMDWIGLRSHGVQAMVDAKAGRIRGDETHASW